MPQTPEAAQFIQRIVALPPGPGAALGAALQPSLDDEAALRRLFATDKANARVQDPHVGLVDVFDAPAAVRTTRARVVQDDTDLAAHYVMPLAPEKRRAEGTPATAASLDEFKRNWTIFTENSLSQLVDWSNVVAAGGSVLGCLAPLPEEAKVSKRTIRKHYHSVAYPTSDIDLFLWGMTPEQAEVKINAIYEAVRDSVPWDVTCVRTKHTVSIHSQYPYRSIQIVLRLYASPAEILAGFDVDAPCCAYDGARVWASPRALAALLRQCNTVDMTRRSPSYEVRLAKYAARGFEVLVPALRRAEIDPTIYERAIARIEGLARLLVLEKLADGRAREAFLEARRRLRGRPAGSGQQRRRFRRKYKGDLKADEVVGGLEMNDYDVTSLHIPYGPGWDARRIDKLIYQTDLGMNSTFNPKNRGRRLHRHPAFFGTMQECLEDCCEHCPKPIDEDERKLQAEEDKTYIRGRIDFIREDPGRQSLSGSFNPIDVGEWSAQVYSGAAEQFFAAIAARDTAAVRAALAAGADLARRDAVGRTPLHAAVLARAPDIARALVDAGARITARLVDGRTPLHLAAQGDQLEIVRMLLARSAANAAAVKAGAADGEAAPAGRERLSSEDDWSSEDDGVRSLDEEEDAVEDADADGNGGLPVAQGHAGSAAAPATPGDIPEDPADAPDIIDINLADWDLAFTPLSYAVVHASPPVVDALLAAGADATAATKAASQPVALHALALVLLLSDPARAAAVAQRLLRAGATAARADEQQRTVLHHAVAAGNTALARAILRHDRNAAAVRDFPHIVHYAIRHPVGAAVEAGDYAMLAVLLAHGARLALDEVELDKNIAAYPHVRSHPDIKTWVISPIESALVKHDPVAALLIEAGAEISIPTREATARYVSPENQRTILDYVRYAKGEADIQATTPLPPPPEAPAELPTATPWQRHVADVLKEVAELRKRAMASSGHFAMGHMQRAMMGHARSIASQQDTQQLAAELKEYLSQIEGLLVARGAKTWSDLHPDDPAVGGGNSTRAQRKMLYMANRARTKAEVAKYKYITNNYQDAPVPHYTVGLYDELFEACFAGDNEKIQQLCLPREGEAREHILQITVKTDSGPASFGLSFTPLYAAVSARRWDTARLILAIAAAQYLPEPTAAPKFTTEHIALDEDEFDDDGSEASDDTVDQDNAVTFTDVAARPSKVTCSISPQQLLLFSGHPTLSQYNGSLISIAIVNDDMDMFTHVADLYKTLTEPLLIGEEALHTAMRHDRPEMLDAIIRRAGLGAIPAATASDVPTVSNDQNRLYLGLNVHGAKRADLAHRSGSGNTTVNKNQLKPLVWIAAQNSAHGIIEYLAGKRPLAAYRSYAKHHTDEHAMRFRRTPDLEKVLPELLGWTTNSLNETPLTAALIGKNLQTVKKLFATSPKLMAAALHQRVKFIGYDPLMLAINLGCDTTIIDYLLQKGVSPLETDSTRGWNILHLACYMGHNGLLDHLLHKLPGEVIDSLLSQPSKGRLNTPLHIAIKTGRKTTVKILLDFGKAPLLARDVDGFTPLHVAVKHGYAVISEDLIKASPDEGLHAENGIGDTALEIAIHQHILARIAELFHQQATYQTLQNSVTVFPKPFQLEMKRTQVPKLRAILDELHADGQLQRNTPLSDALEAFTADMETKLAAAEAAAEAARSGASASEPLVEAPVVPSLSFGSHVLGIASNGMPVQTVGYVDTCNRQKTLECVKAAVAARPGLRRPVNVVDVQKSVQASLAPPARELMPHGNHRQRRVTQRRGRYNDRGGLDPEEDADEVERRGSLVFTAVQIMAADTM